VSADRALVPLVLGAGGMLGGAVTEALEALARISPPEPIRSLRRAPVRTPCAGPAPATTTSPGGWVSRS